MTRQVTRKPRTGIAVRFRKHLIATARPHLWWDWVETQSEHMTESLVLARVWGTYEKDENPINSFHH